MFERAVSFGAAGQWIAALTTTFSVGVSGIIVAWPNCAFPKMTDKSAGLDFSEVEKSWLASWPFIGVVISPIPVSYIMDKIGRKTTLHAAYFLVLIAWLVIAFSDNFILLSIARLMSGFFCGTEYVTVSILVAEYVDPKIRGRLISVTGMAFYCGALYVSLISYTDYFTMCLLCNVPALVLFIIFMFLPESPYYYLMHGRRNEAEEAIIWLRGKCDKAEIIRIENGVQEQLTNQGTFAEIFTFKPNRVAFILVELFKIFSACTAVMVLSSYCTLLVPDSFVSAQDSYILLCTVWVVAAFVSSMIIDNVSRRLLLGISCIGTITFYSIAGVWYYMKEYTLIDLSSVAWVPLTCITFGSFFEIIGIINIPNILKGEIFPVNVKTKAVALSCMTACFFETCMILFYYDMNAIVGEYVTFLRAVLSAVVCLYICIFHLFETRGLDLETIQKILTGKMKPTDVNGGPQISLNENKNI